MNSNVIPIEFISQICITAMILVTVIISLFIIVVVPILDKHRENDD